MLAESFFNLFKGSDIAHGCSLLTGTSSSKGKVEAKSWTEKKPATVETWQQHLDGTMGLGVLPIDSRNEVHWGAIDVDEYSIEPKAVCQLLASQGLPVQVCLTKSSGIHLYVFLAEPVPAKTMIDVMEAIAGHLGFGASEIFPKQAAITQTGRAPDFGSWINMPYFGLTSRVGLDDNGEPLTPELFLARCEAIKLDKSLLHALVGACSFRRKTFTRAQAPEEPIPVILEDGPPCLNRLLAMTNLTGMRNIVISNVAVYLKKRFGDQWTHKLDEYNQKLSEPLPSTELETIKKSYRQKEYRYQCSKNPLCNYCVSSVCKNQKYGIGGQELMPSSRSLTMVDTIPPVWYLDVQLGDGNVKRISCSTEELQNPRLFQRRCMDTLQQMPPAMKMEEWQPVVSSLMQHVTKISVPPELTPAGQFLEHFEDFAMLAPEDSTFETLIRGLPHIDATGLHFRNKDLVSYLRSVRFDVLKQNEYIAILRDTFKCIGANRNIGGKHVRYLSVDFKRQKSEPMTVPPPNSGTF